MKEAGVGVGLFKKLFWEFRSLCGGLGSIGRVLLCHQMAKIFFLHLAMYLQQWKSLKYD